MKEIRFKNSDTIYSVDARSTTPTGTPPKDFIPLNNQDRNTSVSANTAADTSSILKALAEMAKTNTATGTPPQTNPSVYQQMPSSVNPAPVPQAVNVPGAVNSANPFAGMMSSVPNFAQNMGQNMSSGQNMQANPMMPANTTPAALQTQVQLLQMLQAQGVPQDQWAPLLQVLMSAGAAGGAPNAVAQPSWPQSGAYGDASRDRNGYNESYNVRSPTGRYRDQRSRSRSPGGYGRRRDSPPRRRDSPIYGEYGRDGRGGSRRQGGGRSEYRQRSPQDRYRRSDSPRRHEQTLPPPGPKRIDFDHSLPPNHIKGRPHAQVPPSIRGPY